MWPGRNHSRSVGKLGLNKNDNFRTEGLLQERGKKGSNTYLGYDLTTKMSTNSASEERASWVKGTFRKKIGILVEALSRTIIFSTLRRPRLSQCCFRHQKPGAKRIVKKYLPGTHAAVGIRHLERRDCRTKKYAWNTCCFRHPKHGAKRLS